MTGSIKLFDW